MCPRDTLIGLVILLATAEPAGTQTLFNEDNERIPRDRRIMPTNAQTG